MIPAAIGLKKDGASNGAAMGFLVSTPQTGVDSIFIPTGSLADYAWTSGLGGMLLMLIIALPLYVCATASVPIAASLVVAGMPLGAALVFLMASPATNVATVGAVSSEFGRRITVVYISVIAVLSIVFGWLFEIMVGAFVQPRELGGKHLGELGVFGAVIMLALFAYFLFRDFQFWQKRRLQKKVTGKEWISLQVDGMTCAGCVRNIELAVSVQYGVDRVDIDLAQGRVTVHGQGIRPERVKEAIEEAGYQVKWQNQGSG